MDHGVDAGGGGDGRRQAERQLGVEDRDVGQDERRRDAALFLGADGDDRDRRDFRAGAGGGRHQAERQARTPGVADAPGVVEVFAGAAQQGRELGDVERGAAAEADDPGDAGAQPGGDRALERGARGIGLDLVEDRH